MVTHTRFADIAVGNHFFIWGSHVPWLKSADDKAVALTPSGPSKKEDELEGSLRVLPLSFTDTGIKIGLVPINGPDTRNRQPYEDQPCTPESVEGAVDNRLQRG